MFLGGAARACEESPPHGSTCSFLNIKNSAGVRPFPQKNVTCIKCVRIDPHPTFRKTEALEMIRSSCPHKYFGKVVRPCCNIVSRSPMQKNASSTSFFFKILCRSSSYMAAQRLRNSSASRHWNQYRPLTYWLAGDRRQESILDGLASDSQIATHEMYFHSVRS